MAVEPERDMKTIRNDLARVPMREEDVAPVQAASGLRARWWNRCGREVVVEVESAGVSVVVVSIGVAAVVTLDGGVSLGRTSAMYMKITRAAATPIKPMAGTLGTAAPPEGTETRLKVIMVCVSVVWYCSRPSLRLFLFRDVGVFRKKGTNVRECAQARGAGGRKRRRKGYVKKSRFVWLGGMGGWMDGCSLVYGVYGLCLGGRQQLVSGTVVQPSMNAAPPAVCMLLLCSVDSLDSPCLFV